MIPIYLAIEILLCFFLSHFNLLNFNQLLLHGLCIQGLCQGNIFFILFTVSRVWFKWRGALFMSLINPEKEIYKESKQKTILSSNILPLVKLTGSFYCCISKKAYLYFNLRNYWKNRTVSVQFRFIVCTRSR